MIAYTTRNYGQNEKTESNSCLSKIKQFIKAHPYIFFGIIGGIVIIVVVVIVLCVTLANKDKEIQEEEDEGEEINDIPIFPLEDSLKSKVVEIYNDIDTGKKDEGTYQQFLQYISEKSSNLDDAQKVYLAHYWITRKIKYDTVGLNSNRYSVEPKDFFSSKKTVCSGYARLFRQLLLIMNYNSSKIKNIFGTPKGAGYSEFLPLEENHEWNAVEINGKWCLIDTTWDASSYLLDEFYLCSPPKCFVRDHFPTDQSMQFLKNPISYETYEKMVKTKKEYCWRNIEIIEDKAIQNICGRGSVIIKYKTDEDETAIGLNIQTAEQTAIFPQYFTTRIENGYKVDLSINEEGRHGFYFSIKYSSGRIAGIGNMYFVCNEEPEEKIYYPNVYYDYYNSNSQLISPIQRDLNKGQRYTFEVKTSDYDKLKISMENEKISMTKNGDTFKEENVFVHGNTISIIAVSAKYGGDLYYISFQGIGENVGYPECFDNKNIAVDYRLLNPLSSTLTKGAEYKFEIRCYSEEIFRIKYGTTLIDMENINNVYTKTITIDRTTTDNELYIVHYQSYGEVAYNPRNLFKYNLS